MAVYLTIMYETFRGGRETIYLYTKEQDSFALHKYCSKFKELFKKVIPDTVELYIRPNHANGHGLRKGSAMEVTSGTTCPPPPS